MHDPEHGSSARIGIAAEARAVASDMTAIFGASAPTIVAPGPTPRPRSHARKSLGQIALAAAGVAIAAGIYLGRSVPTAPAAPPTARAQPAPRAQPPSPRVEEVGAYALDLLPPPSASPSSASGPVPALPTAVPRELPSAAMPTAAPRDPTLPPRVAPEPSLEAPAPIARPEAAPAQVAEPPAPAATRSEACVDDACLFDRVQSADRQLSDAFARADAAGVSGRTLRLYEREWKRAYRLAGDRPREALRLYAMITSDVRNLTLDARRER